MELTLVRFNDERIKVLPIIKDKLKLLKEYAKGDKHKRNVLYLTSGINYIPTEYWNECKENQKAIKQDIKLKRLEEITIETEEIDENGKKKKGKKDASGFKNLTQKMKLSILQETFDLRSLEKFKEEETEADIRLAIEQRIIEIKEAKTDVTIGHPKSHLKTSGK